MKYKPKIEPADFFIYLYAQDSSNIFIEVIYYHASDVI